MWRRGYSHQPRFDDGRSTLRTLQGTRAPLYVVYSGHWRLAAAVAEDRKGDVTSLSTVPNPLPRLRTRSPGRRQSSRGTAGREVREEVRQNTSHKGAAGSGRRFRPPIRLSWQSVRVSSHPPRFLRYEMCSRTALADYQDG